MKKYFTLLALFTLIVFGCKKYERINPLDPKYEGSDSPAELAFESVTVTEKTPDISSRYFDLSPKIKNIGAFSVGSASNPVSGTLSTTNSNSQIVFGATKTYGSSSSGHSIGANQIKEPQFPFQIKIPNTLSTPYTVAFDLILTDTETNKTWAITFQAILQ